MSSRLSKLVAAYGKYMEVPWQPTVAPIQRVAFVVYDKHDELRLRASIGEFELSTSAAGHRWVLIDVTDSFPKWIVEQEFKEAYFACPDDLGGYQSGEVQEFTRHLVRTLVEQVESETDGNTVIALLGVGALFGLTKVSAVVEGVKEHVKGRLVVFFPGEYHPESHTYRLLDARDGWNYLAVPILAKD